MVLRHGGVDEEMNEQLDRIEEKLDRLLELLERPAVTVTMTSAYPKAPHELGPIFADPYLWQPHETSSSP